MSHSTHLIKPSDQHPEIVEAIVIHNSDWSGEARLRWWPRMPAGHAGARHDETVPGALLHAFFSIGQGEALDHLEAAMRALGRR